MKKILSIGMAALALNLSSSAWSLNIVPPGDRDTQLDRWSNRPEEQVVKITTEAPLNWSKLDVKVWRQPKPAPYVVLLHGSASIHEKGRIEGWWRNADDVQALFYSMGFHVVQLTRRGYGDSEGTRSEVFANKSAHSDNEYTTLLLKDAALDVAPVLQWASKQADFQPQAILVGHSFGGILALHTADLAPSVVGVIDIAGGLGFFNQTEPSKQDPTSLAAILANTKTKKPNLLIYAKHDTVIAYSLGEAIAAQQAKISNSTLISPKTLEGRDPHAALIMGMNIEFWQDDAYRFLRSLP
ncbi:alpha/beta hydrolase [Chitinibacter bivalviorum]|uniref:Alpha/beta hydrolase n=1 Tax=Chitinibacter bivalviorum TaxID=2739434 RepID=A0A7H9BMC1_9NEIS|nr:alpha/beta hydrolase [Chitinibacter bivalviorum]QLG89388.1 alpha/beta hydrolase [Chitinibacter bivalviorum]